MTTNNRPLSPHLQVYRLPLTGIISITHRMTGVFLSIGLLGVLAMLLVLATGEANFQSMQVCLKTWYLQIVLWGFIFALYFHLCHGIRHLIWDIGHTFDKATLNQYAIYELLASVLLFALTFTVF